MTSASNKKLYALVDCNNFYVSCERVFRPDLWHKPVAVLSNNDGCIVARSAEVKAFGIKMATPLYQVQHLIKRHKVHLFSSNYALYADMSQRVMHCLGQFTPDVENYSIDESFLDLTGLQWRDLTEYAQDLKITIRQHTGIPVCIGMGPTKTLAKLANYAAKRWQKTNGVLDLSDPARRKKLMQLTPVNEIWGIGRRTAKRLAIMGIHTAADLARQPANQIQAQFNIVIARTVLELNGISCLSLEEITPKQQIVCSRSFKPLLADFTKMLEALTSFCTRASEKLRQQQSIAGSITVFIHTIPFNPNDPQYQRNIHGQLHPPCQDTRQIIVKAKKLVKMIYKEGYRYQKCGVILSDIQPVAQPQQLDLFQLVESQKEAAKNQLDQQLMLTIDNINRRFPKSITATASNLHNHWQYSVKHLSNHYTTNWHELPLVKCC